MSEAVFGPELCTCSEPLKLVGTTALLRLFDVIFFFFLFFCFWLLFLFLVLFVPFDLHFFFFFSFFVVFDVIVACGSILFLLLLLFSFDCLEGDFVPQFGDNLELKEAGGSSVFGLMSELSKGSEESKFCVKSAESLDDCVDDIVHAESDCLQKSELRVS